MDKTKTFLFLISLILISSSVQAEDFGNWSEFTLIHIYNLNQTSSFQNFTLDFTFNKTVVDYNLIQANGADMRIANGSNVTANHWFCAGCYVNDGVSKISFNVFDNLTAGGNLTYYLYYNNTGVSDSSNIRSTHYFGEDFESLRAGSTEVSANSCFVNVNNSRLNISLSNSVPCSFSYPLDFTTNRHWKLEYDMFVGLLDAQNQNAIFGFSSVDGSNGWQVAGANGLALSQSNAIRGFSLVNQTSNFETYRAIVNISEGKTYNISINSSSDVMVWQMNNNSVHYINYTHSTTTYNHLLFARDGGTSAYWYGWIDNIRLSVMPQPYPNLSYSQEPGASGNQGGGSSSGEGGEGGGGGGGGVEKEKPPLLCPELEEELNKAWEKFEESFDKWVRGVNSESTKVMWKDFVNSVRTLFDFLFCNSQANIVGVPNGGNES